MYGNLFLAAIFVGVVAGAYFQGRKDGGNTVQVQWDKAILAAKAEAEATRKNDQEKAARTARTLQNRLATANQTSRELSDALSRAITAKPLPECVIPDGVRDIINAASRGESVAGAELPSTGGKATGVAKPVP